MLLTRLLPAAGLTAFLGLLVPAVAEPPPAPPPATPLPITKVTLTTAGVGTFVREGTLDGPARVELLLPEGDVNDLLKTLQADDPAGPPPSVSLPSPGGTALRTFRVDWDRANLSIADLLESARGEEVSVIPLDGEPIRGTLLGVQRPRADEVRQQLSNERGGEDPGPVQRRPDDNGVVNVMGEAGLEGVPLGKVRRVQFHNAQVHKEFRQALGLLARGRGAAESRAVSVAFRGQGKRPVSLSHVAEASLWKPSWRLNLAPDKASIQGWATVENTGEEDWNGVRLSLASGRPMTFTMNQYDPLFVPRPEVEPRLYASLRPPVYAGAQTPASAGFQGGGAGQIGRQLGQQGQHQNLGIGGGFAGGFGGGFGGGGGARPSYEEFAQRAASAPAPEATPEGTAISAGADFGRRFTYEVADPVTVPRHQTALVPTLRETVGALRLSIYNPTVLADHPLLGVRLTNSSKQFLAQGPVAVSDGDRYAGDARLPDVEPGESRLLSYAIDLDVAGRQAVAEVESAVEKIDVRNGTYRIATRRRIRTTYSLASRSAEPRTVWVVHPRSAARTRLEPKETAESTRGLDRFEAKLPPGGSAAVAVVEEERSTSYRLLADLPDAELSAELKRGDLPPAVRELLARVQRERIAATAKGAVLAAEEAAIAGIVGDQGRIRDNIKATPPDSETYRRLVKKLDAQETELEQRRGRVPQQRSEREALAAELKEFLWGASAE